MNKIEASRAAMLADRAAKAGISVEELLRRGEAELIITRRVCDIRADRMTGWSSIARKAAAYGRTWEVL